MMRSIGNASACKWKKKEELLVKVATWLQTDPTNLVMLTYCEPSNVLTSSNGLLPKIPMLGMCIVHIVYTVHIRFNYKFSHMASEL